MIGLRRCALLRRGRPCSPVTRSGAAARQRPCSKQHLTSYCVVYFAFPLPRVVCQCGLTGLTLALALALALTLALTLTLTLALALTLALTLTRCGLTGQAEAVAHAKASGHTNFSEFK